MSAPGPTSRAADSAVRLRAAALMSALFLGQLATFLHQATVTHTRCAEHGELMHGDAQADEGAGSGSLLGLERWIEREAPARDSAQLRGLPSPDDHDHDHCWGMCAERARAGAGDGAGSAVAPPATGSERLAAHASPLAVEALYRTAPKTSPPA
jgi:hypothetical protein